MRCEDHRLYLTWKSMKTRCYNPNAKSYKYYGGRGISVYWSWLEDFWIFVEDMYPSFEEGKTLDRVDNKQGYSPWNCRWSSHEEQANNQGREYTKILYCGEFYTESQLNKLTSIPRTTLQARRRKGYSDYEIVHGRESRKYELEGKRFNLKELAEYLGSYSTHVLRKLKKKTIEEVARELRGF